MAKGKQPTSPPSKSIASIDSDLLRELAAILNDTGLTEIEIEQTGLRLRVQRAVQTVVAAAPSVHAHPSAMSSPMSHAGTSASSVGHPLPVPHSVTPPEIRDLGTHPGAVKSPMVGTAYLAPAPGAKNFVEPGGEVKEGQTILIIEAMKTMNQIHAPRSGRVTHIFVDNGQPVEYGEPLVIIE
jgi:acetyl-CoA carboxylase biotin carboxyl carrier protein